MKKEWVQPFWETAQKDRITVRLNITHDDGSFSTTVARVSKFDQNGNINPDFSSILEQHTEDDIEKNTEARLQRHREKRETESRRQQEQGESKRLEELFNMKLQTFEVPAIKASKNRELKSKIRKAKNYVEMQAYATILLMEEMKNDDSQGTN